MAAGLSSRYGGNKQIDHIGPHGEILMEYSVHDALAAGFDRVVFVIKRNMAELFRQTIGDIFASKCEVAYAFQEYDSLPGGFIPPEGRSKPYGTVHAMLSARDVIRGPFAVINADDYYGRDAFAAMAEHLRTLTGKAAAMVAYDLRNTVSENGSVTRGVCEVDADGCLKRVTETYRIKPDGRGGIRDYAASEEGLPLDPDAPVSMNFWGFTPWLFEAAERRLAAFLRSPQGDPMTREYVLPTLIDELMREEGLRVRVLQTHSVWFGVTYREDKEGVSAALRKLHEAGVYPDEL